MQIVGLKKESNTVRVLFTVMFIVTSLQKLYNFLRGKLITLNLYNSKSTDEAIIHREILSTRLFLISMFIFIIILTLSTSISRQTVTELVKLPTLDTYKKLKKQYPDTLQCPCQKISILYKTFVRIIPSFHQVCTSDFISQQWLDFSFGINTTFIWPMDIRTSLSAMWQLIAALCQSATDIVYDTFNEFGNSSIVTSILLSEQLLHIKTQASIDLIRKQTSDSLMGLIIIFHRISQTNALMTGLSTNYIALMTDTIEAYIKTTSVKYILKGSATPCSCQAVGSCPMPGSLYMYKAWETLGLYDLNIIIANETLPGIVVDCLPIQMMLASSLECFYNQSCLNILLSAYSKSINISILDKILPSRFITTTKIESLINELFIENIFNEIDYDKYYHQCVPIYCTYTFSKRLDASSVITFLVTLFGGFCISLHMITPYLIRLILFLKNKRCLRQSQTEHNEAVSIKIRLINLLKKIIEKIIHFNIFKIRTHSNDPYRIYRYRLSSWLYIILLIIASGAIIGPMFSSVQRVTKTIKSPTQSQYEILQQQYPNTIQCPCTVVSMPYEQFIFIKPIYHQICSSDFVQPWLYQSLPLFETSYQFTNTYFPSSSHFRTLAFFCELANLTFINAYRRFSSTTFINAQVLPRHLFILQTNLIIEFFLNSTRSQFLSSILLINAVIQANQYVSGLATNTILSRRLFSPGFPSESDHEKISAIYRQGCTDNHDLCYCARDATCNQAPRVNGSEFITFNGVRLGCWTVNSVLESSLQCWYSTDCIKAVEGMEKWFVPVRFRFFENVTALNITQPSRFSSNTSIKFIINESMIERWDSLSIYENFYQKCNPDYCSYSYEEKMNILYIIITTIGLYGGLRIIFRVFSISIVKILMKTYRKLRYRNNLSNNQEINNGNHQVCSILKNVPSQFWYKLITLNRFWNGSTEINTIWQQRLSTRLYLFLLFISLINIFIFTILSTKTRNEIYFKPSQKKYEKLVSLNYTTLYCPCTQISVLQKNFISISVTFHQVCSSDFVKNEWIDFLFDVPWQPYENSNLRVQGSACLGFLSELCTIAQTTINNTINQFLSAIFVSAQPMLESEFRSQMAVITRQFEIDISNEFSRILQFLRDVTHGSTYISSYFSNWYWWVNRKIGNGTLPTEAVKLNKTCSCGTRHDCIEPGGIFELYSNRLLFVIPGWNIGCSPVETLLRSTLECFYNQTCINILIENIIINNKKINVLPMDSRLPSRFQPKTFLIDIVNLLFIEQWNINLSYVAFYEQCAPIYCSYTVEEHNDVIYIISKSLGLYGGLIVILRFISPYIIKLASKIKCRCCANRINVVV